MCAGMLFYGTKYWGITEANYLLVLLHIMTGILGPEIWIADVAAMLNLKLPFTLLLNDCLLVFIAFFAISYSSAAFYRVLNVDQVSMQHSSCYATPWKRSCVCFCCAAAEACMSAGKAVLSMFNLQKKPIMLQQ